MREHLLLGRLFVVLLALLGLTSGPGCVGCGSSRKQAASDVETLVERFPGQVALVTDRGPGFVRTSRGSWAAGDTSEPGAEPPQGCRAESEAARRRGRLCAELPAQGDEPVRLRVEDDFDVEVHEEGGLGVGVQAGSAVAYPSRGGTSFWTASEHGFEEWLLLDEGIADPDREVATWTVVGASLRQRGESVELIDGRGDARIVVTAPAAFAASGRRVEARLMARGDRIGLSVDADGEAVLVDPLWQAAEPLGTPRYGHTATLLPDGKVLVVGGQDNIALKSAELFDPTTGQWSAAGLMDAARRDHTATLLSNGKVLIAGGFNGAAITGAELYDVAMGTWSAAAPMAVGRNGHTATLLPNGRVIVVGGAGSTSAEIYDPVTNAWTPAASMGTGRSYHTAAMLPNGKVIVTGGCCVSGVSVELYDPGMNTWAPAASMNKSRYFHTATVLGDGRLLVVGASGVSGSTAEIYTPATNTWALTPPPKNMRAQHTATLLPSGNVLVIGGQTLDTTELFDPAFSTFTLDSKLLTARYWHTATLLLDGRVLVAGGYTGSATKNAELYGATVGGTCLTAEDCLSGFCADGVCCDSLCDAGPCDACSTAAGAVNNGVCEMLTGASCSDGDACTQTDTCQAGVCVGASPVVCTTLDPCLNDGACEPATGACSTPAKPDGTACDDGDACTQIDSCQSGLCSGQSPVVCVAIDTCHDAGVCDPATGLCSGPQKPDGATCDDGDGCTQTDTCQTGACIGESPVVCAAIDACHKAGTCDTATGLCTTPNQPDGTACDDDSACTKVDTCQTGVCLGADPVACTALDDCHTVGVCDTATGVCSNPHKPDGAACSDGDACTKVDTCVAGVCIAMSAVECVPDDECHEAGKCDPGSGTCASGPAKPDGTACQGGGACEGGVCSGGGTGGASSGTGLSSGSNGHGSEGIYTESGCGCRVVGTAASRSPSTGARAWLLAGLVILLAAGRRLRGRSAVENAG